MTLSAILGVTEPAIYGVFVKFRRPFIAVMIGGGLGGLFAGLTGVKAYSIAWGLFGLPAYIGEGDFMNLWLMVAAVAISFYWCDYRSYMLGIPVESDEVPAVKEKEQPVSSEMIRSTALKSVVEGEVVPLNEINDQAFSLVL